MPTTPVVSTLPATTATGQSAGAATALTSATTKSMGKEDFLKLLVTQLRFQDPMAPQDPKDFVAQLSQFSSLEQQLNTNVALKAIGTLLQSVKDGNGMSQGVAMLGKTVTGVGNTLSVTGGKPEATTFQLSREAQEVKVTICDAAGKAVRTLNLGRQAAGTRPIPWDGKNDQGQTVPDGAYSYTVSAKDSKGQGIDVTSYFTGQVQGVFMDSKGVWVKVNGRNILLDNIVAINQS